MLPGLIRESGFDYNAIQVVFDVNGIGQDARPKLLEQIIKLINIISEKRRRVNDAG